MEFLTSRMLGKCSTTALHPGPIFLFLEGYQSYGTRDHLNHLISTWLHTAKILFPNRVIVTGTWDWDFSMSFGETQFQA
jgi:hypothetical protein